MSSLFFGLLLLLLLLGLRLLLSPGLASVTGLKLFHIIWQIVLQHAGNKNGAATKQLLGSVENNLAARCLGGSSLLSVPPCSSPFFNSSSISSGVNFLSM